MDKQPSQYTFLRGYSRAKALTDSGKEDVLEKLLELNESQRTRARKIVSDHTSDKAIIDDLTGLVQEMAGTARATIEFTHKIAEISSQFIEKFSVNHKGVQNFDGAKNT